MNKGKNIIVVIVSVAIVLAILITAFSKGSISLLKNADDGDKKDLIDNGEVMAAEYVDGYSRIFGEFTAKTTGELLRGEKENTCYSPVSLFAALTLAAESTNGKTKEELLEGLGVKDIVQLEEVYEKTLHYIEKENAGTSRRITLANSLWIRNSFLTEESDLLIKEIEEKLSCEIFECDLIEPKEVNDWVSEKTNGLIKATMSEEKLCSISLINTLYFKSKWVNDFSKRGKDKFYLEDGNTVEVEYIFSRNADMEYWNGKKYNMANVPMQAGNMIFIQPKKEVKLEELLKSNKLNEILALITSSKMENGCVDILLPQFRCENSFGDNLEKALNGIGINALFDNSEWEINDKLNGVPVEIGQNTKIVVNKDGVEAVAVTLANNVRADEEEMAPDMEMLLDRPFLYILMKNGIPLFIGTVYNPAD